MPKYIEFRVLLPMTVEEYQVAQLYSVAQASKNETGGGEGIEVISNEPFNGHPDPPLMEGYDKGQYTYKCYHIEHKIPSAIRALSPKNSLQFFEEAWNAYPYCRTVVDNKYMKDNFVLKIESMHVDNDLGELENVHKLDKEELDKRRVMIIDIANDRIQSSVHQLTPDKLNKRRICKIDIANDPVSRSDYKADEDPTKFKSEKTGRGPLEGKEWHKKVTPIMCAYKLVTYEFKWFGLQTLVESFIERAERRLFTTFHRQLFCWMDKWYGLTMTDIRRIEDETKLELDNARHQGERRGLVEK